jgi:hypothetical protein
MSFSYGRDLKAARALFTTSTLVQNYQDAKKPTEIPEPKSIPFCQRFDGRTVALWVVFRIRNAHKRRGGGGGVNQNHIEDLVHVNASSCNLSSTTDKDTFVSTRLYQLVFYIKNSIAKGFTV